MPRQAKPPRLYLRHEQQRSDRRERVRATWIVLDRGRQIATGCSENDVQGAARFLADYITARHEPTTGERRPPSAVPIADVMHTYVRDVTASHAREAETIGRLGRLLDYFQNEMLDTITGARCRAYAASRSSPAAARRELEDLRAAINHYFREGLCTEPVAVTLPPRSAPRERWLTHDEVARLLLTAWREREKQKGVVTDRRPWQHVARFILVGVYTGTRAGAICSASFVRLPGRGSVDLDRGVFYRRPEGERATKKAKPPVRLPDPLLAHMRRWRAAGARHVVEWNGEPVGSIRKAFAHVVEASGIERPETVTPHTLRHTAATWQMQAGTDVFQAAGYLGMTVETLVNTYGHHHPDHQEAARSAVSRRRSMIAQRNIGTNSERSAPKVA